MALPAGRLLLAGLVALCLVRRCSPSAEPAPAPPGVAKILAVFDAPELDTMNRVMQKTLIALNKEKWGPAGGGGSPDVRKRKPSPGSGVLVQGMVYSAEWWANQTAEDLGKVFASHQPAALVVISGEEKAVFRVALAAGLYHLPVVGVRAQRGLDDASFRVRLALPVLLSRYRSSFDR